MPSPVLAVIRFRGPGSDSRTSNIAGQLEAIEKNLRTHTAGHRPDLWVFHTCGDGDIVLLALTASGSQALEGFWRTHWGGMPGNVNTNLPGNPLVYLCRTRIQLPNTTMRIQPSLAVVTLCKQGNSCSAPTATWKDDGTTVVEGCPADSCACASTPGSFVVELDASFSHCHFFPVYDQTSLDSVRQCVTRCRSSHESQTLSLLAVSASQDEPSVAPSSLKLDFLVELSVNSPRAPLKSLIESATGGRWHSLGRRDYRLLFQGKSPAWILAALNERSISETLVTRRCWPLLADGESTPALSCYRLPPPFFLPAVCGGVDMGQAFVELKDSAVRLWSLLPGPETGKLPPRAFFIPDAVAYPTILVPENRQPAEIRIPHGFWERRPDGSLSEIVEHELANPLVGTVTSSIEESAKLARPQVKRLLMVLLRSAEQPLRSFGGTAVDLRHETRRLQKSAPISASEALRQAVATVFERYLVVLSSCDRTPEETAALAADRIVGGALLYLMATDHAPGEFQRALSPAGCPMTAEHLERVAPILSFSSVNFSLKGAAGTNGEATELLLSDIGEAVHAIWSAVAGGLHDWWTVIDGGPPPDPAVPYCGPHQREWETYLCGAVHLRHGMWLSEDEPSNRLGEAIRVFIETAGARGSGDGLDQHATAKLVELLNALHSVPCWDEHFGQAGPIVSLHGEVDCELLAWLATEGEGKRYPQLKREEVNAPYETLPERINWWEALDQLIGHFLSGGKPKGPVLGIQALLELRLEQACIRGFALGLSEILPALRPEGRQPTVAFNLGPFWFTPDGRDLARAMGLDSDIAALCRTIRAQKCTPVCELTEGVLGEPLLPRDELGSLGLHEVDLALDDLFGPSGDDVRTFRIFREYGTKVVKRKVAFEVISAWLDWYKGVGAGHPDAILDAINVYCSHSTLWGSRNGSASPAIHIVVEGMGDVARSIGKSPLHILGRLNEVGAKTTGRTIYAQLAPLKQIENWRIPQPAP